MGTKASGRTAARTACAAGLLAAFGAAAAGPKPNLVFILAADPGEKNDLLAARPGDADRLKHRLADWEREVRPAR